MKAPWPKFRTSIMPKASVRPDAMVKIIIPIARPARVRVRNVDQDPMKGAAIAATINGAKPGSHSTLALGGALGCAGRFVESRGPRRVGGQPGWSVADLQEHGEHGE